MEQHSEKYGKVRMNSCLVTQRAMEFLNYYQLVGWHDCNSFYHQSYKNGIENIMLIFTVAGKGILEIREQTYSLASGTIATVLPNTPIKYFTDSNSNWEFYWINVNGVYVRQMTTFISKEYGSVFHMNNITNYIDIINKLISLNDENTFHFEIKVSQMISELFHQLINDLFLYENSMLNSLPMKLTTYIKHHYQEPINIADLCKIFYISQNQLIRIFQSQIGYTPYEYLKKYRLLKACELLQMTNISIQEIGVLVGFPNTSNFIFQFKAQYGVTPRIYRKTHSPIITDRNNT